MQILHLTLTHEMELHGRALSAPHHRQFIAEGSMRVFRDG